MALEIITIQDAKDFCRVDHDHDDWVFELLIAAATEAVIALADDWTPTENSDDVPSRVRLAVLVHVARVYREHDEGADLPPAAIRLLSPLRRVGI